MLLNLQSARRIVLKYFQSELTENYFPDFINPRPSPSLMIVRYECLQSLKSDFFPVELIRYLVMFLLQFKFKIHMYRITIMLRNFLQIEFQNFRLSP